MKKYLALLLVLVLALSLCAGCGSGKTEAPEPTPTPEPVAVVTPEYDPAEITPAMWRVTDDAGHTLYLFGTIHVGDGRNDAAMEKVAPVLDGCDALAVEFDIRAFEEDLAAQMEMVGLFLCPEDGRVTDVLPEGLYDRAKDLLTEAGIYSVMLDRFNVQYWATLVDQAVMMVYADLVSDLAMDSRLIDHAYENDQPVLSVESAQQQFELQNSMSDALSVAMIEETLDSTETYNEELLEVYGLWLSGDTEAFLAFLDTEDETEEARFTQEVLADAEAYNKALSDDRNDGMLAKAQAYLTSGDTVFVAVGAAHMVGEHGLVQLLTDAGYTVERYDYTA